MGDTYTLHLRPDPSTSAIHPLEECRLWLNGDPLCGRETRLDHIEGIRCANDTAIDEAGIPCPLDRAVTGDSIEPRAVGTTQIAKEVHVRGAGADGGLPTKVAQRN